VSEFKGNPHKFFPFGVLCCHCHQWYQLAFYVHHVEQLHSRCAQCSMDQCLAGAMIEEMRQAGTAVWKTHEGMPNGDLLKR